MKVITSWKICGQNKEKRLRLQIKVYLLDHSTAGGGGGRGSVIIKRISGWLSMGCKTFCQSKMLQIALTFNMLIHVLYYAGLLPILGFSLSQKSYDDFCPVGYFIIIFRNTIVVQSCESNLNFMLYLIPEWKKYFHLLPKPGAKYQLVHPLMHVL